MLWRLCKVSNSIIMSGNCSFQTPLYLCLPNVWIFLVVDHQRPLQVDSKLPGSNLKKKKQLLEIAACPLLSMKYICIVLIFLCKPINDIELNMSHLIEKPQAFSLKVRFRIKVYLSSLPLNFLSIDDLVKIRRWNLIIFWTLEKVLEFDCHLHTVIIWNYLWGHFEHLTNKSQINNLQR